MKRIYWINLFASVMITLPCAAALGQLSDAGSAFDLADDRETPLDVRPVDVGPADFGSCCDFQSPCHECLRCRQYLFGDWHGMRPCLAKQGIIADLQLTQFYQGVASGGVDQTDAYSGKLDYQFTFVGEPLGLWKGFTTILHAETRFGEDVNADAGAFAFPNVNMLYPFPGRNDTAITGLLFMQALNERWSLAAGKINALDLWNMLYPSTGRGIDGFMNLSLVAFPTFLRTTNLSMNGAGLLRMKGQQIQSGVIVYDTTNSTTTAGLDNLFDQGVVTLGYWRFFTEMNGLPGSHGFVGNYSTRTYTSVDPLSWTVIPGQGLVAGEETGSWGLAYIYDQVFWADRCNEKRNLRLMSQWALADGNPSPVRWSFNVAIQGQGLIHGRELDTMGVGYFYDELSSDFKQLVSTLPTLELEDVQGVELYYNAEITPWFHLTGDLQIIDNENVGDDTAIILGLRAKMDL
jgi:porin